MCSFPTPFPSTSSNIKNASDELDRRNIQIHVLVFRSVHSVYIEGVEAWEPAHQVTCFISATTYLSEVWVIFLVVPLSVVPTLREAQTELIACRDLKHSWMWSLFNKTRSLTVFRCSILLQLWCGWLHNNWLVSTINEHPRPMSSRIVKNAFLKYLHSRS